MSVLEYRQAVETDLRFVVGSWVDSYRTAHAAGLISMDDWKAVMKPQVVKVLLRPGIEVIVAFKPGEQAPSDIYGWVCIERNVFAPTKGLEDGRRVESTVLIPVVVHYIFVKFLYRRSSIASGLLRAARRDPTKPMVYTCKTGVVKQIADRHRPSSDSWSWMPLIPRCTKEQPDGHEDSSSEVHETDGSPRASGDRGGRKR
jgi:hypothetical protein